MKIKTEVTEDDKEGDDCSQTNDYGFREYVGKYEHRYDTQEEINQPIRNTETSSRKPRTTYTKEQIELLETAYNDDKYPGPRRRIEISESLDVSPETVNVWFKNKRSKDPVIKANRGGGGRGNIRSNQTPINRGASSTSSSSLASNSDMIFPGISVEFKNILWQILADAPIIS